MNLLSHSPVDTPCPGYRYREYRDEALLDDAAPLVPTTPPATRATEERPDVLCPVQIHVQDPTIRERRRGMNEKEFNRTERTYQRNIEEHPRRWIDLDENLIDGYILIDDRCLEPERIINDQEMPFPEGAEEVEEYEEDDTDSHGKYDYSMFERRDKVSSRRAGFELEADVMYPLANSHGNAYQDSSSHNKYSELYSEITRNDLDIPRDDGVSYTLANSHGDYSGISSENRDRSLRDFMDADRLGWDTRATTNYEIANSHSNYRVFYDSQTQHQGLLQAPTWPTESWREHLFSRSRTFRQDGLQSNEDTNKPEEGPVNSSEKKADTPDGNTTCDIEQCLVQIEESLMNIEQNLLHVQDLDIPELRNLLYKSPSIERSLFEVQDLLYADGIVPMITKSKSTSLDSDEEEDEEEEEEEEEIWIRQNTSVKDDDNEDGDAAAGPFGASNEESSDTANVDENTLKSTDDQSNSDWIEGSSGPPGETLNLTFQGDLEKAVNFIPNSLSKTPPRRIILEDDKENIRLCSSEPEEGITIDYNLNSTFAEKKNFFRDKCHSRTNSLDENSKFQNSDLGDKNKNGKISLQNLSFEATNNSLNANGRASSESMLLIQMEKSKKGSKEDKLIALESDREDLQKKIESTVSHRRSTPVIDNHEKSTSKISKDVIDYAQSRSKDRSPKSKRSSTINDKILDKDNGGKKFNSDARKRKKASGRTQNNSDNALVPSKLISLSLSLLLAALLQAVRCLTDLVEDAFKSVSYDRNGLLQ